MNAVRSEELMRLLARYQGQLFRYALALHPDEDEVREILQDVYVDLCQKFDRYDPALPFVPWACRFVRLEVFAYRAKSRRAARLLSPELIERIAEERQGLDAALQARLLALDSCLEKLPPADRELLDRHYAGPDRAVELAADLGTSRRTLFRSLDRIRAALHACITRRLATEEGNP